MVDATKLSKQDQLKKNRKDNYQMATTDTPQFLNINQFVTSRSLELQHFTKILKNKQTNKLQHQLLPRHLRRRAMAHNYYRIPLRVRIKALKEMIPSEGEVVSRSKCRRHRRKTRYLLNQFELRQKKHGVWMETHIWHAKRFKMQERWGVKYPVRCSDKSDRSTYRLAQHDSAIIMDKSFFSHFQISLTDQTSLAQLSIKLDNEPKFYERDLVSQGDLICPAQILVHSQYMLVTVHPSCADQAKQFLQSLFGNCKLIQLNDFQIYSKSSALQHLYNVLEPLSADPQTKQVFKECLDSSFDNQLFKTNQVIALQFQGPSNNFRMNEHSFKNYLSADIVHKQSNELQSTVQMAKSQFYYKHHLQLEQSRKSIQDLGKETSRVINFEGKLLKPVEWIGTQRTPFTHRKKMVRIKHVIQKTQENLSKPEACVKGDVDMDVDMQVDTALDAKITIFIVKLKAAASGLGQSYKVIVPSGYGLNLWRRLVYSGCKPIAEREELKLLLECQQRVFPYDYPQTQAGQSVQDDKALERLQSYIMRPPSKRVNYQSICQPMPFRVTLKGPFYFYICTPVSRGVPETGSLIYLPHPTDLKPKKKLDFWEQGDKQTIKEKPNKGADNLEFNTEFQFVTKINGNLSKQQTKDLNAMTATKILNQDLTIQTTTVRQVIGFVTNGGFSQALGHGIGMCASIMPVPDVCLFRKLSSLQYHLCQMRQLK